MTLLIVALVCGVYAAFACSADECGSGKDKCCTDVWDAAY